MLTYGKKITRSPNHPIPNLAARSPLPKSQGSTRRLRSVARNRRLSSRSGHPGSHMAKQKGAGNRTNRRRSERGALAGSPPQGASKRETSNSKESDWSKVGPAGHYSCAILTKEEMLRTIAAFAECLERSATFPTRCDIVERAKDGMFALHIMVYVPQVKSLRSNLPLEATEKEKP